MQATGYLNGSISRQPRKGYEVWELRYRLPNGKQSDLILKDGPDPSRGKSYKVWTKQSRPPTGYLTRSQAEALAQRFLDAHAESVPDSGKTFGRAVNECLERCRNENDLSPNTVHDYERITTHLKGRVWGRETWEIRPLSTFEPRDFTTLVHELRGRGVSNHTINIWRGVLRNIFGKSHPVIQEWRWGKSKQTKSKGKIRVYDPEQVAALIEHAADLRDRAVYVLGAQEGMRTNEFRGLKIANLNFAHRIIHIEDGFTDKGGDRPTKTYAVRPVPMTDDAHRILFELVGGQDPYDEFGNPRYALEEAPGVPIDYWSLNKRFKKAQKAAELPYRTLHELRHTFGTVMVQNPKIDIYKLQRLMGHRAITTTAIYLHYRPDPDLQAEMSGSWAPASNVVSLRRAS